MRKTEICMKALALILAVGAACVAYGREMLNLAFAENKNPKIRILVSDEKRENSAIAELEDSVVGKRKMSMIRGKNEDIPLLCKNIKYNCRDLGDYLLFSNSNQKLYFSSSTSMCVYFTYDCPIGEARYGENECKEKAERAVRESFSGTRSIEIKSVTKASENEKTIGFFVITDISDEAKIYISIRRDTGSVVLYDAREIEKCILSQKKDNFH